MRFILRSSFDIRRLTQAFKIRLDGVRCPRASQDRCVPGLKCRGSGKNNLTQSNSSSAGMSRVHTSDVIVRRIPSPGASARATLEQCGTRGRLFNRRSGLWYRGTRSRLASPANGRFGRHRNGEQGCGSASNSSAGWHSCLMANSCFESKRGSPVQPQSHVAEYSGKHGASDPSVRMIKEFWPARQSHSCSLPLDVVDIDPREVDVEKYHEGSCLRVGGRS